MEGAAPVISAESRRARSRSVAVEPTESLGARGDARARRARAAGRAPRAQRPQQRRRRLREGVEPAAGVRVLSPSRPAPRPTRCRRSKPRRRVACRRQADRRRRRLGRGGRDGCAGRSVSRRRRCAPGGALGQNRARTRRPVARSAGSPVQSQTLAQARAGTRATPGTRSASISKGWIFAPCCDSSPRSAA